MSEWQTLARPYAKALFELACEEKTLDAWSNVLAFLSQVANDKAVKGLLRDSQLSAQHIFIPLLKKANLYNKNTENLILLLAYYRRLHLLPMIAQLYQEHKAELEKTIQVSVTSAFMLSDLLKTKLKKALEIRLQREVELSFSEDKALIGGAIIRANDLVIDASVKSKLEKLRNNLCH